MMKTPTFQTSIPPIQQGSTGDDLVASVNDRLRRIELGLTAAAQKTVVAPTTTTSGGSGGNFISEIPTGVMDGTNVTFTLTHAPNPAIFLFLFLNGVYQHPGVDYTLSGTTITMTKPPVGQDYQMRANYVY